MGRFVSFSLSRIKYWNCFCFSLFLFTPFHTSTPSDAKRKYVSQHNPRKFVARKGNDNIAKQHRETGGKDVVKGRKVIWGLNYRCLNFVGYLCLHFMDGWQNQIVFRKGKICSVDLIFVSRPAISNKKRARIWIGRGPLWEFGNILPRDIRGSAVWEIEN